MARRPGTPARVQRLTSLVATLLVALTTAWAFARVFQGHAPGIRLLLAGLVSGAIAWAMERRNLLLATVVSGACLISAIGLLVFAPTTWHGLPTLETLRHIGTAATAVGEQARIQVAPTPPVEPLMLAGITAVWASVFSCHALAFRAGSPLLALVPPVALLAFADTVLDESIRPLYGVAFLAAGIAVAFADGLRRIQGWGPVWSAPGRRSRVTGFAGRGARRAAAGALTVALVAPVFIPGFGSKAVFNLSKINGGDTVQVDPLVSIGAALNRSDPVEVFHVTSDVSSYWRMVGLDEFDGTTWRPSTEPGPQVEPDETLAEAPLDGDPQIQVFDITANLGYLWLPAAPQPTRIALDGTLQWDGETQTATTADPLQAGDSYTVTSVIPHPTPNELDAVNFPAQPSDPSLTEIPSDLPPEVEALARQWTQSATTTYDKIRAIQDHLSENFSYSTQVPYRDDSAAIVQFLTQTKSGFCQQFASSMALMLRTLGIPARVAVGFTPGEFNGSNGYTVTTDNLHSWVEVPFPGIGWLPFEPTPTMSNPQAKAYQFPTSVPDDCKGQNCNPKPPPPTDQPNVCRRRTCVPQNQNPRPGIDRGFGASGSELGSGSTDRPLDRRVIAGVLLAVILLILAAIPPGRSLVRRRRLRRAGHDPRRLILATYDVFAERASDLGYRRGPGETPDEFGRRLVGSGHLSDGHLDRLTRITVRAAFALREPTADDALDASADASHVLEELREATPRLRRLTGIYRRD